MSTADSSGRRSWEEACAIHGLLGPVCERLLEAGYLNIGGSQQQNILRAMCESALKGKAEPVSASQIAERIGIPKRARSISSQISRMANLRAHLTERGRDLLGADFPVVIGIQGEGRGQKRFFDLPGLSAQQVERVVLQVRYGLDEGGTQRGIFGLLIRMSKVFELLSNEEAEEWFRKRGPITVDFQKNRVYRNKQYLESHRKLILDHHFVMLEGIAATGKSVLVRTLGYDFLQDGMPVHYFKCGEMDFRATELAEEINNASGVVIVEDIHLAPREANAVYGRLRQDRFRHVVFTARSSFREALPQDVELIHAPTKKLESFLYADELISFFLRRHELQCSDEHRSALKRISEKSLWLLAYALKGYDRVKGAGDPQEWIGEEVKKDLNDLRKINTEYPKILVALSPLYMNEVLTAKEFLIASNGFLRFAEQHLQQLEIRGEITRVDMHGHTFYGLPHSALASLYWKWGSTYRNDMHLPDYEEFIYKYAASDTPNGLKAMMRTERGVCDRLMARFHAALDIVGIVARERCMTSISDWLWWYRTAPLPSALLATLAEKIAVTPNVREAAGCLEALHMASVKAAFEVCQLLDLSGLIWKLNASTDLVGVGH